MQTVIRVVVPCTSPICPLDGDLKPLLSFTAPHQQQPHRSLLCGQQSKHTLPLSFKLLVRNVTYLETEIHIIRKSKFYPASAQFLISLMYLFNIPQSCPCPEGWIKVYCITVCFTFFSHPLLMQRRQKMHVNQIQFFCVLNLSLFRRHLVLNIKAKRVRGKKNRHCAILNATTGFSSYI